MSDLGSLTGCLVDSDTESLARARRLRRKALLVSLILEGALIAAMLLVPMVTPGVLPRQFIETPMPPFSRAHARADHPSHPVPAPRVWQSPKVCLVCPPQINKPQSPTSADLNPPDIDVPSGPATGGPGIAGALGPEIAGAIGTGKPPDIPRGLPEASHQPPRVARSSDMMQALLINSVHPEYPAIARAAHLSGVVRLHAIIGRDGMVRDLKVLSGNAIFIPAALAAVREWRYRPTLLNNQPVEVETYITVKFVVQ